MKFGNQETKVHFKSYKAGKHWVVAGIATSAVLGMFALAGASNGVKVNADVNASAVSVAQNDKTSNASKDENKNDANANQVKTNKNKETSTNETSTNKVATKKVSKKTTKKTTKKVVKKTTKKAAKKAAKKVVKGKSGYKYTKSGVRYLTKKGTYAKGLLTIKGVKKFFNEKGYLVKNKIVSIKGKNSYIDKDGNLVTNKSFSYKKSTYLAKKDGELATGLQTLNNQKVYFSNSGKLIKGLIENINGKQMFFDPSTGYLITDKYITVNKVNYHADLNGYLSKDDSHTDEALMTNAAFSQNFHYNVPRGYSNDIQSIIPHTGTDGKVDYYDVYYLYNPYPNQKRFSNEWYHAITKDFKTFTPFDQSNPTSLNNVAIPYSGYTGSANQVVPGNKTFWKYVATGAIVPNNGRIKKDQWGNKIDANAKLAYFTDIEDRQYIDLVYSNNDEQFKPVTDKPVLSAAMFKIGGVDFRDVQVLPQSDGSLIAYVAGGWTKKIFVFRSTNGIKWTYNSKEDIDLGTIKSVPFEVETPLIRTINGQTFMFFSWHSDNIRASAYVKGSLDKNGVFKLAPDAQFVNTDGADFKSDVYAGNSTNLDSNNLININWSGNWLYSPLATAITDYDSLTKHSGTITIPRLVQNVNGTIKYVPIEPDNKLVSSYRINSSAQSVLVNTNNKLDFTFDSGQSDKTITFKRNQSTITITLNKNGIEVKRQNSLYDLLSKDAVTALSTTNITKLEVYVDNTTIELYLPEANKSYNIVNFSSIQNEPYFMSSTAAATVDNYQFGQSDGSTTNDGLSTNITKLQGYLQDDSVLINALKTQPDADQSKVSDALNKISQAQASLTTAQQNIQTSVGLGTDVRASLYTDIANDAYKTAKNLENSVSSIAMNISNSVNNNGIEKQNGSYVINGHNTWFVNGKRTAGQMITDDQGNTHYYDAQTGYEAVNTFYVDNGAYYYFDNNGNMVKNQFVEVNPGTEYQYYFGNDGKALLGKRVVNGAQYDFGDNGIVVKNSIVKNSDGTVSYYGTDGKMATSDVTVGSQTFKIDSDGTIQGNNTFVQSPSNNSVFYYLKKNKVTTGIINNAGNVYKFDSNGEATGNTFIKDYKGRKIYYISFDNHPAQQGIGINNQRFNFNQYGQLIAPNQMVKLPDGSKFLLDKNSNILGGVREYDGYFYAFTNDGKLRKSGTAKYKGKKYKITKGGTLKGLKGRKIPKQSDLANLTSKAAVAKKILAKEKTQLSKLKNKHTAKYKTLLKKYNSDKKSYDRLNNRKNGLAGYFKNVGLVNKAKAELTSVNAREAKAKKTLKKHNTKKNRAALKKLKAKTSKINKTMSKYYKEMNAFKHRYK
ncbi:KxYKxGKxW signal peptide domain-containing protein [Apilactobacillus kunkeei]|uniref:KxYKxGKxW signal peptide domain-containing protein n=1 Tax=Apilactobacillus kunkeei TaxID=148814 RepID=UPI001362ECF8|nr:KxYKxGKxW signal peptide domain-containing protein [Apilactobacillus kunkeei]MBI0091275.1 KxYKxGKxW signal peptide domain-containing protein [Lactobacillus sp. M0345]MCK8618690.1 KxYKxGKxW signal peptide domain-containing protein [Apilactobacillus kunkeei]CAI2647340.1 hypothetical protein AKUH3B203M01_03610 [Apilactobacillus kunkeei]CAI2647616.1 hypothetical protein AKUH3B203M_12470 [Apilactobacillus kunkeei]CAI2651051.1 hypothetical protein AKUH4B402J_12590 [Apilactobacillus kunkeei]